MRNYGNGNGGFKILSDIKVKGLYFLSVLFLSTLFLFCGSISDLTTFFFTEG